MVWYGMVFEVEYIATTLILGFYCLYLQGTSSIYFIRCILLLYMWYSLLGFMNLFLGGGCLFAWLVKIENTLSANWKVYSYVCENWFTFLVVKRYAFNWYLIAKLMLIDCQHVFVFIGKFYFHHLLTYNWYCTLEWNKWKIVKWNKTKLSCWMGSRFLEYDRVRFRVGLCTIVTI